MIQLIKEFVNPGFILGINSCLTGVCGSCKTNLYFNQKGKAISKVVETSWLNGCQVVCPSIHHPCNKKEIKDPKVFDRVISHVLKEISIVGNSMNITLVKVGKALPVKMYRDRPPVRQIRSETILNLKINHNLPDCVVLGTMKEIRKDFGRARMQNTFADVKNRSHY